MIIKENGITTYINVKKFFPRYCLPIFLEDTSAGNVQRFVLPGSNAINFLLHEVLGGGGVASIRNDPQAKGYAQLLLSCPVRIPTQLAETLS